MPGGTSTVRCLPSRSCFLRVVLFFQPFTSVHHQEWEAFPGPFVSTGALGFGTGVHKYRVLIRNTSAISMDIDVQARGLENVEIRFPPKVLAPGLSKLLELFVYTDEPSESCGSLLIFDRDGIGNDLHSSQALH